MSVSVLFMSMSLDGYIAGPNDEPGNPGGDGFMRLHEWFGDFSRPAGALGDLWDEWNPPGAIVVGRRTVEQVDHWGGDNQGVPIFVPSHRPPDPSVANYPLVTYVLDGIESAMAQAKAVAGDGIVLVHGAYTAQRALEAPPDPGVVRRWPANVRGFAVASRTGDRPGDRHARGNTHPLSRSPLSGGDASSPG